MKLQSLKVALKEAPGGADGRDAAGAGHRRGADPEFEAFRTLELAPLCLSAFVSEFWGFLG